MYSGLNILEKRISVMSAKTNANYYNVISIICGTWFLFTGGIWVYYANLFISFPIGLIGMLLWYKGKQIDKENKLNKAAIIIHIAGLAVSIIVLVLLLFYN
jgi:hypothetical protein